MKIWINSFKNYDMLGLLLFVLSLCLSVSVCVCLSVCLSVCHLSIYLFTQMNRLQLSRILLYVKRTMTRTTSRNESGCIPVTGLQ